MTVLCRQHGRTSREGADILMFATSACRRRRPTVYGDTPDRGMALIGVPAPSCMVELLSTDDAGSLNTASATT